VLRPIQNFSKTYKEKEMADFRRLILALTVLALCAAGAYAQVGIPSGGPNGTSFSCTAVNGAVTPSLRQEGLTEMVGDIVINCTGGTNTAVGSQIQQATITVFLNTQVTSRLIGSASGANSANASEAVLFIDEPNTGLPGYGPTVPMSICTNPGLGGCPAYVSAAGTPVTAVGGVIPSQNVYQGVVDPVNSKYVTFYGVPMMPPASAGDTRVFRITNVRVNANGIPAGAGSVGNAQALISISNVNASLTNSQLIVGYVQAGLTGSLRSTANSGSLSSSGAQFSQCSSAGDTGILRFGGNTTTAFKTRVIANDGTTNGSASTGQNAAAIQDVPGGNYTVSESGFIFNGAPQNNIAGAPASPTFPVGPVAGLADFGTRLQAVFSGIPAGVSINVSTVNVLSNTAAFNNNGAASFPYPAAPAPSSVLATYAQLIISATSPENGTAPPVLTSTGFLNSSNASGAVAGSGVPIVTLTPAAGTNTVTAVWEVVNSNTTMIQNFDFLVNTSYSSNTSTNTPAAPSSVTVSLSYAPISSTTSASSSANIPRFVDLGTGDNKTLFGINICQTSLLFPYVSTITGFTTGIAISNTSMDPFGTVAQNGACTLWWYGNNTGGTTNTPVPNSTTATSASPTILAGTTFTADASASNMAGQGFTGYMIAVCNFQYAHGYAAVTDIGTRGILTAYLALVLNSSSTARTGVAAKETLTH
jgi:hypothetical protein